MTTASSTKKETGREKRSISEDHKKKAKTTADRVMQLQQHLTMKNLISKNSIDVRGRKDTEKAKKEKSFQLWKQDKWLKQLAAWETTEQLQKLKQKMNNKWKERYDFDQLLQQLLTQEHEKGKMKYEDEYKERKHEKEQRKKENKTTRTSDNKEKNEHVMHEWHEN